MKNGLDVCGKIGCSCDFNFLLGQIAQMVERRTENPCVPGSIPGLATI